MQFVLGQCRGDFLGKVQRVLLHLTGEHHRGVGRHVAVRGVARRLDRDAGVVEPRRDRARSRQIVERSHDEPAKIAENISH